MKPASATLALIALAAATAGFAQTAPPPDPPAPQQQQPQPDPTTQPSEPGAGQADQQALMKDCVTQVQAANPGASQKDVKEYCVKEVTKRLNSPPAPHD